MNNIYIPSYNRADLVRTYEYLETGHIIVPKSQEKEYKKRYGKAVITIPDKQDGFVAKKRNAVLDLIKENETNGYGWICDDDFIALKRKKENIKMSGEECLEHFERIQIMAQDMGAMYGGFDYSSDNMKLKDMTPFGLTHTISGSFMGFLNNELRFDERIPLKEDYDYSIQNCNIYRKVLRINNAYMVKKDHANKGGCAGYRTIEREKEQLKLLQKKWGNKIVKTDVRQRGNKIRTFDLNPIIRIPIKGI